MEQRPDTQALTHRRKSIYVLKDNQEYHLFASYCCKDKRTVREFLCFLENVGLKINDPERDFVAGETVFRNIIERGLEISKMFIMFITKNFLSSPWCSYESDLAVWKYVTTKGKYRVIPIVMEPCRIPSNLRVLNCIHAWKYRTCYHGNTSPKHLLPSDMLRERVVKAITSPPLKFRRFRWSGMKTFNRGKNLVKKMQMEVIKGKIREEKATSTNGPFNFLKLLTIVDDCVLQCKHGHCGFNCSGRNFLQFHKHLNTCRYRPTKCCNTNCNVVCQKWELDKHLEECKHARVRCEYDGCRTVVSRGYMETHKSVCSFKPVPCPNKDDGCENLVFSKDIESHLQTCDFAEVQCENCESKCQRQFQEQHLRHCPLKVLQCQACKKETLRKDFSYHQDNCPMTLYKCENVGCDATLTRAKMIVHKNECYFKITSCQNMYCDFKGVVEAVERHKIECQYKQIKCDKCGRYINKKDLHRHQKEHNETTVCDLCKMVIPYTSRHTHRKWICPRRNFVSQCDICNEMITFLELEDHKNKHYESNETRETYNNVCLEYREESEEPRSMDSVFGNDSATGASTPHGCSTLTDKRQDQGGPIHADLTTIHVRRRCASEPSEYCLETLMMAVAEPDVRAKKTYPPLEDEDMTISGTFLRNTNFRNSRQKFTKLWKAIDQNNNILSMFSKSKRLVRDKAFSSAQIREFLKSC